MLSISPHSETRFPLVEDLERLPAQAAEDWLFAYANARNTLAREAMWPHLVEAVEVLIDESRRLSGLQSRKAMPR